MQSSSKYIYKKSLLTHYSTVFSLKALKTNMKQLELNISALIEDVSWGLVTVLGVDLDDGAVGHAAHSGSAAVRFGGTEPMHAVVYL